MRTSIPLIALACVVVGACGGGSSGKAKSGGTGGAGAGGSSAACQNSLDCVGQSHGLAVCDKTRGTCVECVRDADCNSPEHCVADRCAPPCTSDKDCTQLGLLCNHSIGYCAECAVASDCSGGMICSSGECRNSDAGSGAAGGSGGGSAGAGASGGTSGSGSGGTAGLDGGAGASGGAGAAGGTDAGGGTGGAGATGGTAGNGATGGTGATGGAGANGGTGGTGGCPDADGDGVCDANDICPGYDDHIDTDNDGIPDGCEQVLWSHTLAGTTTGDYSDGLFNVQLGEMTGLGGSCGAVDGYPGASSVTRIAANQYSLSTQLVTCMTDGTLDTVYFAQGPSEQIILFDTEYNYGMGNPDLKGHTITQFRLVRNSYSSNCSPYGMTSCTVNYNVTWQVRGY